MILIFLFYPRHNRTDQNKLIILTPMRREQGKEKFSNSYRQQISVK